MECKYCKSVFSTKTNLNSHQKTAKYCFNIRVDDKPINIEYKCIGCNKVFSRKQHLDRHVAICKANDKLYELENIIHQQTQELNQYKEKEGIYEKQLFEYKKQIQELQNKLENIAVKAVARPTTSNTTTNNTNIMNLAPLDMTSLTEHLTTVINTQMTEKHVLEGQEGIAKLISCCFTTDDGKKLITCTDISRGVWKSKDINGNIIKDYKANNIAKVIKPIATMKADQIIELDDTKRSKINEIERIRKKREERIKADEFDMSQKQGYVKNSSSYKNIEIRMKKRIIEQQQDDELEQEIFNEFKEANELYLLELPDDIDKPFRMFQGKQDIVEMADDSSKFSSKLVSLV